MTLSSGGSTDLEDLEGDCPVFVDREGNFVEVRATPQRSWLVFCCSRGLQCLDTPWFTCQMCCRPAATLSLHAMQLHHMHVS